MGTIQQSWEQIVSQKRIARDALLAPYLVDDVELRVPRVDQVHERSRLEEDQIQQITDIDDVQALLQKIQDGSWSAEQVVKAYINR